MQFNIDDVKAAGALEKKEVFSAEALLGAPPAHARFKHDLRATAKAQFTSGSIYVSGVVKMPITYQCSRCLSEFDREISGDFAQIFNLEEVDINIDNDIRETVLLDIPIKPLCKEDCQGICPQCGANKNKTDCSCDTAPKTKMGALLKDFPFN